MVFARTFVRFLSPWPPPGDAERDRETVGAHGVAMR